MDSPSLNFSSVSSERSLQPAKLLIHREDYVTCHIRAPEEPQRLSAIALEGKFYSFFRALREPTKTLGLLLKLTARGNQVAMTPTNRGYVIWVHEPDSTLALPANQSTPHTLPLTFGPANCWVIGERQPGYQACSLKLPDLPDDVLGLADSNQKLYSLYRREGDAAHALKLAAKLVKRGDEVILLVRTTGYILCVYEPGAKIAPPS
ncbi:MAG: hypothetical protein AAGE59_00045 [Cyanobacteria bacterium P01_F01_bin.86]